MHLARPCETATCMALLLAFSGGLPADTGRVDPHGLVRIITKWSDGKPPSSAYARIGLALLLARSRANYGGPGRTPRTAVLESLPRGDQSQGREDPADQREEELRVVVHISVLALGAARLREIGALCGKSASICSRP